MALLENVRGLLRHWDTADTSARQDCRSCFASLSYQVWTHMADLRKQYWICKVLINPNKLGCPVSRGRVYVVLAKRTLGNNARPGRASGQRLRSKLKAEDRGENRNPVSR